MIQLPLDFQISGILNQQSGYSLTLVNSGVDFRHCGSIGFNCRAVMNGGGGRSMGRNKSVQMIDLRVGKFFRFGGDMRLDVFVEAFNLYEESSLGVGFGQRNIQNGNVPDTLGIPSFLTTRPRQLQIGGRLLLG